MTLPPQIEIAAAVNDRAVLANCLSRSPDIASGLTKLRTYEDFPSAGAAYNSALAESDADYLILAHQDVYLPRGYVSRVADQLRKLTTLDANWGVAGIIGLTSDGSVKGHTWSSGLAKLIGERAEGPQTATTLDEVLLIIRRDAGLLFDPELPSFHLYATDIMQESMRKGMNSYIIDAPVIHHSRPVVSLSGGYIDAYRYLQRKWKPNLPIPNLICPIRRRSRHLYWQNFRIRLKNLGNTKRTNPADDPVEIARRLGLEN